MSASKKLSLPKERPALLINTSIFFHWSSRLFNVAKTVSLSCTLKFKVRTLVLNFSSKFCFKVRSLSFLLPVMIKSYPAAANFSAQAFPIPEVAPVIKTILDILCCYEIYNSRKINIGFSVI